MKYFILVFAVISIINSQSAVTVNLNKKYQTIRGFGGINLPDWIGDLTKAQREKAFKNGYDQLGFTMLRVYVSDDKNAWKQSLETAKFAQSQGATIFASPWNPPSTMTEYFNEGGRQGKRLKKNKYADYANHLNDFVKFFKQNGVTIYGISIQNEPDYGQEWTWWTSQECVDFLANYRSLIQCKVLSPETFQYNKVYYNAILDNPKANKNVDVFATHFYGTLRSQMDFARLENDPREIWMTEVYVPNSSSQADTWPEAIEVAVNIHNALVVGSMNAYVWWYIRRSYGPMKEDGKISKRGYMMAQFSKYIRPGAIRVFVEESPTNGVYISAYKNQYANKSLVIIAINNGNNSFPQRFNFNGMTIKKVDRFRTSESENLAVTQNLAITEKGFWAQLNSKSVSTFVIT
jgi:glucuronoarabinoxylan endo-1,4-beta-xylanase